MLRIAEVGLAAAVCMAVLAFGGTAAPFFLAPQLIVLTLGVLFLAARFRSPLPFTRLPWITPFFLVALVLLQLLPWPDSRALRSGAASDAIPPFAHFTLSVAPYQTESRFLLLIT